jgi:hypothetical protein
MPNRPLLLCRLRLGSCPSQAANQTGETLGPLVVPEVTSGPAPVGRTANVIRTLRKPFCVQDLLREARQRMMLDAVDRFSNISPRRFEKVSASI